MIEPRRKEGVVVPPMSEAAIAGLAGMVRRTVQQDGVKLFPIVLLYEMLCIFDDAARFEVIEDHQMGDDDARTHPDRGLILLRESVYNGAARGEGRPRFTMAHELGHLVLHRGVSFNRVNPEAPPKIFRNSEWQSDVFSSHLLMPTHLVTDYRDPEVVARDFGVSYWAAEIRLAKMKKGTMKQAS